MCSNSASGRSFDTPATATTSPATFQPNSRRSAPCRYASSCGCQPVSPTARRRMRVTDVLRGTSTSSIDVIIEYRRQRRPHHHRTSYRTHSAWQLRTLHGAYTMHTAPLPCLHGKRTPTPCTVVIADEQQDRKSVV